MSFNVQEFEDSLPEDWSCMSLADSVKPDRKVTYGIVQPGKFTADGILLIRGQDYIKGWASPHEFFRVNHSLHESYKRSTTNAGDVLVCIVGATTGSVNVVPDWISNANITQTTARISCDPKKVNSRFVYHALDSNIGKRQVRKFVKGSAQPGLNLGDVEKFVVPLPAPEEQRRIAEILDTADEAIQKTEALIAKLKQMKAGLLHDLLTRGIDENGELRKIPKIASDQYKETSIGLRPKCWREYPLHEVIDVGRGFAFRSSDYVENGILNFRATNVGERSTQLKECKFLPKLFWNQFPKQQLFGGEIVIIMVGATTGTLGRIPTEVCPALLNQNMWNLIPKEGFDRDYVAVLLPEATSRHMRQARGSARDFLSQKDYLKTPVVCAAQDSEEQKEIVRRITSIADWEIKETNVLEKYKKLKAGLMHDLLTGNKRVNVAEPITA